MMVFTAGDSLPKHFNIVSSLSLAPWTICSVFDFLMAVYLIPMNPNSVPHSKLLKDKSVQSEELQ